MVTKRKITQEINRSGASFEKCWSYLSAIKSRKINTDNIVNFQPTLASALFDLSALYRNIAQEKKKLINRKHSYTPSWFSTRMASLSSYQEAINQAIGIGKGIGDGFAWFFYQKNRNYLREHLSQEEIFHGPPGVGGIGELEFAKNVRMLYGYFVLHHGTTNILRLGDISLIDLSSFSVAGIGEIKTSPVMPGKIEISLLFSGPGIKKEKIEEGIAKEEAPRTKKPFMHDFPENAKSRLKRQVKRITDSYNVLESTPERNFRFESDSSLEALKRAFENSKCGRFHFEKASKGLAIGVYRERRKLLSTKLLHKGKTDFSKRIDGVEACAIGLINTERDDNSMIIGGLYYDEKGRVPHLPGMSHLFWWPLSLEILRSIIFKDTVVITLFNPAQLVSLFESAGFTVELSDKFECKIYKNQYGKKIYIEGFSYYWKMITEYLFTEEGILKMVKQVEDGLDKHNISESTRIELQVIQEF